MLEKPKQCEGCPYYGNGKGFVPDRIEPHGSVLFIGDQPTDEELSMGQMFSGWSGNQIRANLGKYGVKPEQLGYAKILKCKGKGGMVDKVHEAITHCCLNYLIPNLTKDHSNLTVVLGEYGLNKLVGHKGLETWRGSIILQEQGMLAGRKICITINPASLYLLPYLRSASKSDFARIARECRGKTPVATYTDNFRLAVSGDDFIATLEGLKGKRIALDIETSYDKPIDAKLKVVGIAWSMTDAMNVRFDKLGAVEQIEVINAITKFNQTGELVTATPFDYTVLQLYGVKFTYSNCHDLTLLHSRFDIELDHTLEFIASMWTNRNYWKYLAHIDNNYYNALDCVAEWEAFEKLYTYCREQDKGVYNNYNQDRLMIPVCVGLHITGLPQDVERFEEEKLYYVEHRDRLREQLVAELEGTANEMSPIVSVPSCPRHPRYSGKTSVKLRKGESTPCPDCLEFFKFVVASKPLKLSSKKQLGAILKRLGMQMLKDKESGNDTVAKGALGKLFEKYKHGVLKKILEFNSLNTVVGLYFKEAKTSKVDGRIHSEFKMHAAKHRWSSTKPNVQQFKRPERLEDD
jgi:uracil-DNA glycosylase family 4